MANVKQWASMHNHTWYSLLDGLSNPVHMAKRGVEGNLTAIACTDHGNISAAVDFLDAFKGKSVKPILGNEFYVPRQAAKIRSPENRQLDHCLIIAKNHAGWKDLIKATSNSNKPEFFYYKPRMDLDGLANICSKNWLAITGHPGSTIANKMFGANFKTAYRSKDATEFLVPDYEKVLLQEVGLYQDIFGYENFFLEVQIVDQQNFPAATTLARVYREFALKHSVQLIATADAHYVYPEDCHDQRVLICKNFNTTMALVHSRLADGEDVGLSTFFKSDRYYIPTADEMVLLHKDNLIEVQNALKAAEQCESYNIFDNPKLPTFSKNEVDELKQLCYNGLQRCGYTSKAHMDRLDRELKVIFDANLSGYFLIVNDYTNWAKSRGALCNLRGSGVGAIVCKALGLSHADPLEFGLIFERFYNAGRNTKDRVALPDLDMDFPIDWRDKIFDYVKGKYGADKVCQMVAFHTMQGKMALKDLMKIKGIANNETINRITKDIPNEAAISDKLQEMKDAGRQPSILLWCLENMPDAFSEYCLLDKNGHIDEINSKYPHLFKQAIRMEGVKTVQSKHAAGVIITNEILADHCPMIFDKNTENMIAGIEMEGLEKMGYVKFDMLSLGTLDRIMETCTLIKERHNNVEENKEVV